MKNKSFINISILAFTFILAVAITSCSNMNITYLGKGNEKVEKIALVSTMIGKIYQPTFPLIDASMFNTKTNKIADQIMDMQKKQVTRCQDAVAKSLQKNFACTVIYGDGLIKNPSYEAFKNKYNFKSNLRIEDKNFSTVIIPSNEINPFKYNNANFGEFFDNPSNYKATAKAICDNLKTDHVAISISNLSVNGVSSFGIYGYLCLVTNIYLFNKEGELVTKASTWSQQTSMNGDNVENYKDQFSNISTILDPMLLKVALNFQPQKK
jgi:hypothetical protein